MERLAEENRFLYGKSDSFISGQVKEVMMKDFVTSLSFGILAAGLNVSSSFPK